MMEGMNVVAGLVKLLDVADENDVLVYVDPANDDYQVSWWTDEARPRHVTYVLKREADGWQATPIA